MNTDLTKAEESHVERMGESFKPTTMQENFEGWASRVKSEEKKSAKEEQVGPRSVSLKGRPDEEREWIEKVAEKAESERERFRKTGELPPAKEKPKSETEADSSKQQTEHEASAAESQKPGADNRSTETESDVPHFLDKGWTKEAHENRKRSTVSILHDLAKERGADGKSVLEKIPMPNPAGDPKANEKINFFLSLLADTRNPAGVLHYFADHPDISKNWQWRGQKDLNSIMDDFRWIDSKVGRGGSGNGKGNVAASQASPKPRAPKPPPEVGGRGGAGDDGTKGETNFSSFGKMQSARYYRR